ncbi:endo alpha-1,4 polygalactosaminidase [Marinoscillum pacificum]|uniref:endo alpha-1,4 polygalactosaminidase n=1 Tax=Marinoscillum pacificum TaxID=392723 RepID=UPI0021588AE5|nr:endo alpha-1,4 polygalactosaminidase [Marinoscillum pacificum]
MLKNLYTLFLLSIAMISCGGDEPSEPDLEIAPIGGVGAVCVFNHAYQENYDPDPISLILSEAKSGYVLIDPYENVSEEDIARIQAQGNEVGAYISIGAGENWRDDFNELKPFLVTKQWGDWEGEYFVNETTTGIVDVLKKRVDWLAEIGCDWVEFDNMDWVFDDDYRSAYGFNVTVEEGIAYSNTLCDYVHSKGMKCMAKNMTEGVSQFEGVLYESYSDDKNWWDTTGAKEFLSEGKLVIINHYGESQCNKVYADYLEFYGDGVSYICEDENTKSYKHYNCVE